MNGKKYDGEKPKAYLLPPKALIEVAKVLTFGANKYDENNWKKLDNLQNRYTGAALRHILAHMDGEELDDETGLDHIAHAICCLMFKLEAKLESKAALDELAQLGQEIENGKKSSQETGLREPERFEHTQGNWTIRLGDSYHEEGGLRDTQYSVQYNPTEQDYRRILRTYSVCEEEKEPVTWSPRF